MRKLLGSLLALLLLLLVSVPLRPVPLAAGDFGPPAASGTAAAPIATEAALAR